MNLRAWPPWARLLLEVVILAAVYFGAARLGLSMAFAETNASPVWPPTGVALAAVLLCGYRIWPGIFIGALLANVVSFTQNDVPIPASTFVSSIIGVGNTLEAVTGTFLIRRFVGERHPLDRVQDVFRFMFFAVMLAPIVSATIGVTALCLGSIADWPGFAYLWWTWWLGDAMGALVITPALLVWIWQSPIDRLRRGRWLEAILIFGLLVLVAWLTFKIPEDSAYITAYHLEYLIIPFIVWATLRFRQLGATTSVLITMVIAVWYTVLHLGPFTMESTNDSLLLLQTYLAVVASMALILAAVLTERATVEADLRQHHNRLEEIVTERTTELVNTNTQLQQEISERLRTEEAWQESQQMLQLIMDNISLAIFWKDKNLIYLGCNRKFVLDAGLDSPGDVIGRNDFDMPWVEQVALYRKDDRKVIETGVPKLNYEEPLTTPNGDKIWVRTSKIPLCDVTGNVIGVLGMYDDITDHRQAEEALRQRNRELAMLNQASRVLGSTLNLDQVLSTVLEEVHRLPDVLACSIWLADRQTDELVCREVTDPQGHVVRGWRLAPGEGLAGWVVQHTRSLNVPDVLTDERYFKGVDEKTGLKLRSVLTVPLQIKKKVIGVMQVVNEEVGCFHDTHQTLLESLASTAAIAIQNAQWYEQARQDAETKLALFHEVNHRVKNNLAAIIGLLYAERRHATVEGRTYQDIMNALINRVQGLATVHELLSASEWRPLPLSKLAEQIIHAVLHILSSTQRIFVEVTPSSIKVSPAQANQLAMIINELTTNTMKYALNERNRANITIHISEYENTICFEFRDDGPGYPEDVLQLERHNVGLYLIQTMVQSGLHGELELCNDHGAVTLICFETMQKDT